MSRDRPSLPWMPARESELVEAIARGLARRLGYDPDEPTTAYEHGAPAWRLFLHAAIGAIAEIRVRAAAGERDGWDAGARAMREAAAREMDTLAARLTEMRRRPPHPRARPMISNWTSWRRRSTRASSAPSRPRTARRPAPKEKRMAEPTGLPAWLDGDEARELREDFPEPRRCDECGLPLWVCFAISEEAIRRGGSRHHRVPLEAEARAVLGRGK